VAEVASPGFSRPFPGIVYQDRLKVFHKETLFAKTASIVIDHLKPGNGDT
jgi:hypothetical protein